MARNATQEASLRAESHGGKTATVACLQADIRQLRSGDPALDDQLDGAVEHASIGKIGSFFLGKTPCAQRLPQQ
jgi:hypothetical protein